MKKIGFFDDSVGPGGTTRYLSSLISGLDRSEFDLVLFALQPREWHREFEAMGVEIVTLSPARMDLARNQISDSEAKPARRFKLPRSVAWWLGLIKETLRLRRLFSIRRVDLFHSNQAGAEPAPIAARLAGIPVVIATWHVNSTVDVNNLRGGLRYRLLERACMRSLHHAIPISRATANDWVKRCNLPVSYRRRITVVHNGVDVGGLQRRGSVAEAKAAAGLAAKLVIGSMGRLEQVKGYKYLIQALPSIIEKYPETLVRIAGSGELEGELKSLANEMGVAANVEFCGFTADIQSFLEALDIYAQPSLSEALGLAILEASAVGIPVVASEVGGVPESVIDGKSGFLVRACDSGALAEALGRLASDPALRQRMACEGHRNVAENYRCDAMVEQTVAVYRSLLGLPVVNSSG